MTPLSLSPGTYIPVSVADDVLFVNVACLICFVDIPIPCTSGGAFEGDVLSAKFLFRWSVRSKKSNIELHSSLSNCITGTSCIDSTPSQLFAIVSAYQLPCEIIFYVLK